MRDREYRAEVARIKRVRARLRPLSPPGWTLSYEFYRGDLPDTPDAAATATCQWAYLRATISINCESTSKMEMEELEELIAHEQAHCYLAGVQHLLKDQDKRSQAVVERSTEELGRVLIRLLRSAK